MKKWLGRMLIAVAVIGVALIVYFEPTHTVRSWLWGEALFRGQPASHWRQIVAKDLRTDPRDFINGPFTPPPARTMWDEIKDVIGLKPRVDSSFHLLQNREADGVLKELTDDEDAHVAGFARAVLEGVRPRQPFDRQTDDEYFAWIRSTCEYRSEPIDFEKMLKEFEK